MRPELDPLVTEYQHENQRPRQQEALQSLRKIASLVKPIMRQRNWYVGTLSEFYPAQINLLGLNINRGEKICLRLRYPGDANQFLPIEQVVDTMLHELCHNVHGPHNEHFHALWNQLRDEYESLIRKGYTGEGFLGKGERVGGARIPMHEARRRATAAAERRQQLYAGSGQRLGGTRVQCGADIRKIIADAAQRRITIEKGCASNTDEGLQIAREVSKLNGFRTKADEDDANERAIMEAYIDLIQEEEKEKYGDSYRPPTENNPSGPRATASPPPVPTSSKPPPPSKPFRTALSPNPDSSPRPPTTPFKADHDPIDLTAGPPSPPIAALDTWTCTVCTLVNPLQYLQCDACLSERPPEATKPSTSTSRSNTPSGINTSREKPNALKPRLNAANSLKRLEAQEKAKPSKPMGWTCTRCGNWMEQQWWTCAGCGTMKTTS